MLSLESIYYQCRRFVPGRMLYDPDYFAVLRCLSSGNEKASDSIVAALLATRLSEALRDVPFYRENISIRWQEVDAGNVRAVLSHFPYLTKELVMQNREAFLSERYRDRRKHYTTSGGSSGQGIGVWRTKRQADIEKGFFVAEWGKLGFSFERSRTLRVGADARRREEQSPLWRSGNRLMLSPYHLHERWANAITAGIRRFSPDYIHGYPSAVATVAKLLDERGEMSVKGVLLASEPAMEEQLRLIGRVFHAPISVNYGLTERTNLAFANYAEGQPLSYRFNDLYGITEFAGDDVNREIVGTSLWNDVFPLIRYRTGDHIGAAFSDGGFEIVGRNQEFLVSRFGSLIPGLSIVIDERTWDFVKYYQVHQSLPGEIVIKVVPRNGSLSAEQRDFIRARQIERWGDFFGVSISEVSEIPLTKGGKRRLVISEIAE
ncbi:hypothetical protein D8I24_7944 [Cupriavidus necator H850]|uniref:hypothetical protein n=1 Tax=Cupriavidus necator TaxID=106590 RepID=UPI00129E5475|nr:hypothetical protein [Cupriavidus necator]KAI3595323.1 hypothetical protein D8I24_7944 [Cupriavidus necator H850]